MLEIEQSLKPALGNFGLIRRVGGVPARVFQYIAPNRLGRQCAVVAGADVVTHDAVARSDLAQFSQRRSLGDGVGQGQWSAQTDRGRYGLLDQVMARLGRQSLQHCRLLLFIGAQVTGVKFIVTE